MYILVTIADLIQIAPQEFEKRSAQAIEDNINAKYSDKVIHKVGLCLGLYDILNTSEGLIGHGTGIVNVNVDFRLIVFRPFKGEILQGKIVSNTPLGIRITMDFFEDIFVPAPYMLFEPSHFDQAEQTWVWSAGEGNDFFFDNYETVRFRVEGETWTDLSPDKQMAQAEQAENDEQTETRISPYEITASMQQSGLGPLLWWDQEDDPIDGEEYAEEGEGEAQANGGADEVMEGMS
ncbi:hypothetical protein AAFC00_006233 [Neodothiora populina]|uniref:DNA-directed RNA polymerase subunit n=1 Tax=Neodothiora populina TaxID=2781224 RepID=A0ABR3P4R5_9PEZI